MNSKINAVSCHALMSLAGLASAQPGGDLYASGLLHQPLGQAQLGPVEGRRLPVSNLGSSGQDGVNIALSSSRGGSVSVGAGELGLTTGSHRTRYKGWDGTIKGRFDAQGLGNGTTACSLDLSGMGAVAIEYTVRDEVGNALGTGVVNDDTFDYSMASWSCPSGYNPIWIYTWYQQKITGIWKFYVTFGGCSLDILTITNLGSVESFMGASSMEFRIVAPGGDNNPGPIGTVEVTGTDIPLLTVEDATLRTFGAECWGTGDAHISEECSTLPPCDASSKKLVATNIGSSGQDGVAIGIPPAASMSFDLSLGDILTSPAPGSARASIRGNVPGGLGELTSLDVQGEGGIGHVRPDFSGLGSSQYRITLLDDAGLTVGEHVADNGFPFDCQVICGPDQVPVWGWVWCPVQCAGSPLYVWTIVGCGNTGVDVGWGNGWQNARTVQVTPVDPTALGDPTGVSVLGRNMPGGMELSNFQSTDRCPADYNGDGFVSGEDFDGYVAAFESGDPSADFNHDGFISGDDFDAFVLAFETGC